MAALHSLAVYNRQHKSQATQTCMTTGQVCVSYACAHAFEVNLISEGKTFYLHAIFHTIKQEEHAGMCLLNAQVFVKEQGCMKSDSVPLVRRSMHCADL